MSRAACSSARYSCSSFLPSPPRTHLRRHEPALLSYPPSCGLALVIARRLDSSSLSWYCRGWVGFGVVGLDSRVLVPAWDSTVFGGSRSSSSSPIVALVDHRLCCPPSSSSSVGLGANFVRSRRADVVRVASPCCVGFVVVRRVDTAAGEVRC